MQKKLTTILRDYEILMLVVMAVFVVAFMINVNDNPRAGRLFPMYVGLVTLILIAIEAFITLRKKRKTAPEPAADSSTRKKGVGIVTRFVFAVFVYFLAIIAIGYVYASFLFLVLTMWLLGVKSKVEIFLISIGTMAVIYLVFAWGFSFTLPQGKLF